jgi:hypothetical protein
MLKKCSSSSHFRLYPSNYETSVARIVGLRIAVLFEQYFTTVVYGGMSADGCTYPLEYLQGVTNYCSKDLLV